MLFLLDMREILRDTEENSQKKSFLLTFLGESYRRVHNRNRQAATVLEKRHASTKPHRSGDTSHSGSRALRFLFFPLSNRSPLWVSERNFL